MDHGKIKRVPENIYFCFIDYAKAFDCVDHNKLWKILKEMGIPDHLNCLLRNLYAGQEATVITGHGTTDWFRIGKGIRQTVYCHPESTSWIQDCWGNINNLKYADDTTTLMAESEQEENSVRLYFGGLQNHCRL